MAEDLAPSASSAADAPHEGAVSEPFVRPSAGDRVAYRMRFALAYLALAAVAGAALGAAVVLFDRPTADQTRWSEWAPTGAAAQHPTEIARHVAPRYRDAEDRQLVTALAGPPEIQGEPLIGAAIQADTGKSEDAAFHEFGDSVVFQLCGGAQSCAFADGQLDEQRFRLLRQESLELALYSFKYVGGLDSVVALLPPDPDESSQDQGDATTVAMFFRRGDLQPALERPLHETLPSVGSPRVGRLDPRETLMVDRLTRDRAFTYTITRIQTGSPIMLLDPLDATAG